MKNKPYPHTSIENFIPSTSIVRAASESFDNVDDDKWVKYSGDSGQIQYCNQLGREHITPECLLVLDYISTHLDPDFEFGYTTNSFPDITYYGGGMMITPNKDNEGGYLGMHVDAITHGKNKNWKREYSAILCISDEYDSSFDLVIHDGDVNNQTTIPYKFNQLNIFKCSENSWHGLPEISKGFDRKTLGVMFWSKMSDEDAEKVNVKAQFYSDEADNVAKALGHMDEEGNYITE